MAEIKLKFHTDIFNAALISGLVSLFIISCFLFHFTPIMYVFVILGSLIALFHPKSGLLSIVFLTMIFERFFTLAPFFLGRDEYKLYPLDIILIATLLGSVGLLFHDWKNKNRLIEADYALTLFIFINIVYFFISVLVLKTDLSLSFSTLKNYAFYSLLYFATALLIRTERDVLRLFKFFLAGATGIIIFILLGAVRGEGLWTEYTPLTTSGTRILAFTHGFYISLVIFPYLLYISIHKYKKENLFPQILALIWTAGIIGTMMRHIWAGLGLTLVFLWLFVGQEYRKKMSGAFLNIGTLIFSALFIAFYFSLMFPQSQFNNVVEKAAASVLERGYSMSRASDDDSFAWRKLVWSESYKEFKNNPILGIGTGKRIYVETEKYRDYVEVRNIHNSYLAILIQLGLLGMGTFLYFLYQIVKKIWIKKGDDRFAFYKFSLLSALVFYFLCLPFQPYLETNLLAVFFWIILALNRNIGSNITFEERTYENFRS